MLGICDSANPDVGPPFDCEVLGTVLHFPYLGERIGVPARAGEKALDTEAPLDTRGVPVVALAGTCMDSGKTQRRVRLWAGYGIWDCTSPPARPLVCHCGATF